ncbi:hypothetical protein HZA99_05755 [Candidatus Woesearchaeota archaeon]|nr:hypothetical protein [Candidatus Woesearchaeota archaeon]
MKLRLGLEEYLAKVCEGPVDHEREYPNHETDHKGNVTNNGFIFYEQQIFRIPPDKKVMIHSMSYAAPVLAYIFDLPMYRKGPQDGSGEISIPEAITRDFREWRFERVPGAWKRFLEKNGCPGKPQDLPVDAIADLRAYEYGGRKELIERYLL